MLTRPGRFCPINTASMAHESRADGVKCLHDALALFGARFAPAVAGGVESAAQYRKVRFQLRMQLAQAAAIFVRGFACQPTATERLRNASDLAQGKNR
jgi:hypothetical protein